MASTTSRKPPQKAQQRNQQQRPPRTDMAVVNLDLPAEVAEYGIEKATWLALQNLFPGARWQSQVMAYEYCQARGLDVLKKPVHIVPMYIKDAVTGVSMMRDVILPGITETRITASRTKEYAGQDPAVLGPMIKVPVTNNANAPANVMTIEVPQSVTVTVYRLTGGKRFAYSHTEYFLEACARKNDGLINAMWQKRPIGQLTKCAEAGALRKAFAEEIGGEYTAEEMEGQQAIDMGVVLPDPEHGASGIPEPGTKPQQGEVVDAEFTEAPPAKEAEPEAKQEPDPKVEAKPDAQPKEEAPKQEAAAAPAGTFTVELPTGAHSIITSQLKSKGVTEDQLLAKLNDNLTVKNINQALALLKSWGA